MADPGAASAAIAEVCFTEGTADYVLGGALAGNFGFADGYSDGVTITVVATNGAATEIVTGTFDAVAGTISRATVILPLSGKVPWPTTGQRIIRPLVSGNGFTICATPAVDGQVLVWQGADSQWCPDQRVIGPAAAASSGDPGSTVTIAAGAGDGVGAGGAVSITAGAGDSAGAVSITAGAGDSAGGAVSITAGAGDSGAGGAVSITSGAGVSSSAGAVTINGGAATDGGGGAIQIQAGDSTLGTGGNILITSGDGQGVSNITIQTGSDLGGDGGNCSISAGASIGDDNTGQGGILSLNAGSTTRDDGYGIGGDVRIGAGGCSNGGANSGLGGSVAITAAEGDTGGVISLTPGASLDDDGADVEIHMAAGAASVGALRLVGTDIGSAPSGPTDTRTYRIYIAPAGDTDAGKLMAIGPSGTKTILAVP